MDRRSRGLEGTWRRSPALDPRVVSLRLYPGASHLITPCSVWVAPLIVSLIQDSAVHPAFFSEVAVLLLATSVVTYHLIVTLRPQAAQDAERPPFEGTTGARAPGVSVRPPHEGAECGGWDVQRPTGGGAPIRG